MIMCQSRPLEPRMDCPHPWGGPSAVQNFEPTDLQMSLTKSGSDRRTVRSPGGTVHRSKSEDTQKPQCFCPRIFSRRQTVRPQGPDGPQFILDTQDRTTKFLFRPPTEPKTVLFELIRDNGGPSAPLERTVRRYISSRNVPQ